MPPAERGWSGVAEEAVGRIEALSQTGHRQWVLEELERLTIWSLRLREENGLGANESDGQSAALNKIDIEVSVGRMGLSSDLRQRLAKALMAVDRPFEALALLHYPTGPDAMTTSGHMGSMEEGILRADLLVGIGEWDEAGRVYQAIMRAGREPGASAAGLRYAVLSFATGDLAEAWDVWAQLPSAERDREGHELLWLVERELRLLLSMFPSGYPFPATSGEEAKSRWQHECTAGGPLLEAFYSHLLAMTFLDELGAIKASLSHLDHAMRLCPSKELHLRRLVATPIVFPSRSTMAAQRQELLQALQPERLMESAAKFPDRGPPEKAPHLMFSATPAHMFIGYQVSRGTCSPSDPSQC